MRRKWCSIVMVAALAVCLAGCGARKQQKETAEEKNIIFSKYAEDGFLNLYSVSVLQTDDGETVPWEKAERIGSCYEEEIVGYAQAALCEPYLIYREDAHTLVRLDMETGDRKTYTRVRDRNILTACT